MESIVCNGIGKIYGKKQVLKDINLTLEKGKIYGLIGRNGAGKTTLLSIMSAQNPASEGTVTWNGENVWENRKALDHICFSRELSINLYGSGVSGMKVKDYLNSYNKEDLVESAKELEIPYEGLSKEELAEQIAAKVLDPEVMKSIFLQADEWEIDAFDHASTRKCFLATHKDWKELEWFSNKGYIVAYSDNHAEVPQEVIAVYNQINTPELQEKCRKLSWMRSCESMMGLIYAIAPLKIVYRMYRKRDGFRVSYEEFMDILNELAEKDGMCIVKGDKLIWKAVLQDNLYERIEEFQGERDFYIPTVDEILDYAKHGYPSQDVSYRKLSSFLRDELHLEEEKTEELLYIVYKEFSMDGMLSDIMEEFNKRDIVFDSDRQMERFAPIMMEVNNNTRMLDFRGYTPNEVSRVEQAAAPAPVAPAMPSFVPMANTPAVNMQPKKKVYPNDPCPCGSGKKYKKCCGRN